LARLSIGSNSPLIIEAHYYLILLIDLGSFGWFGGVTLLRTRKRSRPLSSQALQEPTNSWQSTFHAASRSRIIVT
jgi:hypothetical protein